ncbi:PREDICTED: nudix hydrolase 7 isoform X1 [Polistes dominula]|uniref:Nudix hydrolase 7 isoform X1 n=1 Tax=Polistes dominula TaxID=743375 RepID=A0ABM1IH42_POLDO|nr:PREDICTED: nudix hydrolase 7 isoform X1 [Polistes dominula]
MYNTIVLKLFRVTKASIKRDFLHQSIIFPSILYSYYNRYNFICNIKYFANMSIKCFQGRNDNYNGVTVHSIEEPCLVTVFPQYLQDSLKIWSEQKKRTIWFRVHLSHSEWIPILVENGFKFHHAREEYVMLYYWLNKETVCNIPPYAHTNLGVGAFVFNEKTSEILVVKEKNVKGHMFWKLPGGYIEPGENIDEAAQREVLEETGIQTMFKCLVAFRHSHNAAFDCSDIYMIAYLTPCTFDITKCEIEISECKWIKLNEYLYHPEVHENNRLLAKKMIEFLKNPIGITAEHGIHPITKKPLCVYSISTNKEICACEK